MAARIALAARLEQATTLVEEAIGSPQPAPVFDAKGAWTRASEAALARWLGARHAALARAELALHEVHRSPHAGLQAEALGRTVTMTMAMSDQLVAAPLPPPRPRDSSARDAYCRALRVHADDLMMRALEGVARCGDVELAAGVIDEAAACRRVEDRVRAARTVAGVPAPAERVPAPATIGPSVLGALEAPVLRDPRRAPAEPAAAP